MLFCVVVLCKRHCCEFCMLNQATLIWLHKNFYILIPKLTDFNRAWWNSCDTQNGNFKKFKTVHAFRTSKQEKESINCVNFIAVIQFYISRLFINLEFCLVGIVINFWVQIQHLTQLLTQVWLIRWHDNFQILVHIHLIWYRKIHENPKSSFENSRGGDLLLLRWLFETVWCTFFAAKLFISNQAIGKICKHPNNYARRCSCERFSSSTTISSLGYFGLFYSSLKEVSQKKTSKSFWLGQKALKS